MSDIGGAGEALALIAAGVAALGLLAVVVWVTRPDSLVAVVVVVLLILMGRILWG
jgi:hypothetical protein